jgi:hypothetical protein
MAQMGFFDLSDRYASLDAKKDLKWSGKFGQRAKMYPTLMNGYGNDEETELFRQV